MELPKCFETRITLNINSKEVPDEVCNEVREKLWPERELGDNDTTAIYDATGKEDPDEAEDYPILCAYIASFGLKKCYINYGW
jgi:hypothetical protein